MAYFVGLDVSVKETSVCIVDDAGKIVRETRVASEPEALLQVLTARDAEHVVRAAKFAPLGDRSIAGGLPHLQFRTFSVTNTINALNEATMVVIMIESAEALAEVDQIAAVEGVDLL
jgi:HpcH/HpaI aldolase/citrate lyase family